MALDEMPPDQPISLKDACEIIFEGAITPATLKAEHKRGNLELLKIGRAYFTTRRHVEAMIEKCRLQISGVPPKCDIDDGDQMRNRAALAAVRLSVEKLKAARRKR